MCVAMDITTDDWPGVDKDSLSDRKRALYYRREKAVLMLISGSKYSAIQGATGIARNNLLRLIERCEARDQYGVKIGFRGLIPYRRINKYIKRTNKGYQGAFDKLMNDYPELKDHIEKLYLGKRIEGVKFRELSLTNVHKSFISLCHKLNISENEYPLCTKTKGRESLRLYCKNLSKNNVVDDTHNRVSIDIANDLRAFQDVSSTEGILPKTKRPFAIVQIDGHSEDVAFLLRAYNPCSGQALVIYRFWLILAIDVASKKILGYSFSLNSNYRLLDLIYCLINSLTGEELYTVHTDVIGSNLSTCLAFDMITLDNHMSHRSPQLIEKLSSAIGATIRLNPGGRPKGNAVVERVFGTLRSKSSDILPSSLGSKHSSPKRYKPDKFARDNEITYEFIKELIERSITDYNNKFHSSTLISPNSYIKEYFNSNTLPYREINSNSVLDLLNRRLKATIRGKTNSQVRPPHINFKRAKYYPTNVALAYCYYGTKVNVVYNLLDLRTLKVYLSNGEELCDFIVENKWNKRHSFYDRNLINQLLNSADIMFDANDYVGSVLNHAKKVKKQNKNVLKKVKQGDIDRTQPTFLDKSPQKKTKTQFTYPKFDIFDNL